MMEHGARVLLIGLLTAILLPACGDPSPPAAAPTPPPLPFAGHDTKPVRSAFPAQDRLILEHPERTTLLTLNPQRVVDGNLSPEAERLRSYGVTGKAVITDPDEHRKLVEALYRGLKAEGAGPAHCFHPRHALRFELEGRAIECLICFECTWIYIYGREGSEEETRMLFSANVEPVLASVMRAHGLTKAD